MSQLPTVDDGGQFWRRVITDTESLSGVAPVCDMADPTQHVLDHGRDEFGVYDCCPQPHLECWGEQAAADVVEFLNARSVRICD